MSKNVPYHPSLNLGNIISPSLMNKFDAINQHMAIIDKAKEKVDGLILNYRSLTMTQQQIKGLDATISTNFLDQKKKELKIGIEQAAKDYFDIKTEQEQFVQNIDLSKYESLLMESPLDYKETSQKYFPWSVDSLKLDYQYFSFLSNKDSKTIDNMKSFLRNASEDSDLNQKALDKLQDQYENLNIEGSLIISATCTHKNVLMLEPFKLDRDRAVKAWNQIYKSDTINIHKLQPGKQEKQMDSRNCLHIISGAVYGSCFIGMVHLVKENKPGSHEFRGDDELIKEIRRKIKLEQWMAYEFGNINPSQEPYIKNLLSNEEISIHLNLFVTGTIPEMASKELESGIKIASDLSSSKMGVVIKNVRSFQEEARESQSEAQKLSYQNAIFSNLLSTLTEIDKQKNKILDVDSLVTAFTNYVKKITETEDNAFGMPLSYYTRCYSKADIIDLWFEHERDQTTKEKELKKAEDKVKEE